MTRDDRDVGTNRAWTHYTRTDVILPGYQGVIAERIAERERSRDDEETDALTPSRTAPSYP